MLPRKKKPNPEINASSMADIAFLLLIFFLVVTNIASDKGISVLLPPKQENQVDVKINQRNIFKIQINSSDKLLLEDEPSDISQLKEKIKVFVSNRGRDASSSESPDKAVVSLKTDRGTSYEMYISVLDLLKVSYSELRAEYLGIDLERFNALDKKIAEENDMLERAKLEYPYQVSDAEPTDINDIRKSLNAQ